MRIVKYKFCNTFVLLIFVLLSLSGCASIEGPPDERDPWESYNRAVFSFNDGFDRNVLKPVAEGYRDNVPDSVQSGVSNFFSNLNDVTVFANDIFQFKFEQAVADFTRFLYNTVFGVFGIFDVASHMDLPKHNEDFGQTLGSWGVGNGPYLMIPFLPPSTVRDTAGLVVDTAYLDPVQEISDDTVRYSAVVLNVIDRRAQLLSASKVLDEAALDRYAFLRDAYLQNRLNLVYDGNPPRERPVLPANDSDKDLELELELELELQGKQGKSAN